MDVNGLVGWVLPLVPCRAAREIRGRLLLCALLRCRSLLGRILTWSAPAVAHSRDLATSLK